MADICMVCECVWECVWAVIIIIIIINTVILARDSVANAKDSYPVSGHFRFYYFIFIFLI